MKNIMTLSARGDVNNIIPETLKSPGVEVMDITRICLNKKLTEVLNIQEKQEVMQIRRVRSGNDKKKRPVEFVQTFYRSDQFKYTLTFGLKEMGMD